jgi:hypothetical protein
MGLVMNSSKSLLALVDSPSRPPGAPAADEGHSADGTPAKAALSEYRKTLEDEEKKLKTIEAEYRKTARRQAQLVYVAGAIAGAIVLTAVVLLVLWLLSVGTRLEWLPTDEGTNKGSTASEAGSLSLLYLCAISGGLGAIVSVIARINTNSCAVDEEAGPAVTGLLGALRPALGAVFGVALYAAVISGLLALFTVPQRGDAKEFYFFLVIAFLAGFSERWARDVLIDVEGATPMARPPAGGATT